MAEHEIIKYTKRAYKVSRDSEKSWKEKIVEIVIDIAIIVFAVSLSLYLHHRSELKAERALAEEFLRGLRIDLKKDTAELSSDSATYRQVQLGFRYFLTLRSDTAAASPDSLAAYRNTLFNSTELQPNSSRFEGLKSAGKLYVMEDKELLNDILDLYQEKIPALLSSTNDFSEFKRNRLAVYLDDHLVGGANGGNLRTLIKDPVMQNYLLRHYTVAEILDRYHEVIEQCRLILSKINKEYPE